MQNEILKNGFLCINKPTGVTSFEVVSSVKRSIGIKHVGHLGTIDKAGAGVLPIAVGSATKFFDYFLTKDKEYIAYFKFGSETDTLDSYGTITKISNKIITKKELENAAKTFLGKSMQEPPMFSAVKVNGRRASDRAIDGENLELKKREIEIFSFDILDQIQTNLFVVKIACSAGTYIRSIVRDIAKKMGTVGTMVAIIRTKSGEFNISNAILPTEISWDKVKDISSVVNVSEIDNEKLKRLCSNNNE